MLFGKKPCGVSGSETLSPMSGSSSFLVAQNIKNLLAIQEIRV